MDDFDYNCSQLLARTLERHHEDGPEAALLEVVFRLSLIYPKIVREKLCLGVIMGFGFSGEDEKPLYDLLSDLNEQFSDRDGEE